MHRCGEVIIINFFIESGAIAENTAISLMIKCTAEQSCRTYSKQERLGDVINLLSA